MGPIAPLPFSKSLGRSDPWGPEVGPRQPSSMHRVCSAAYPPHPLPLLCTPRLFVGFEPMTLLVGLWGDGAGTNNTQPRALGGCMNKG